MDSMPGYAPVARSEEPHLQARQEPRSCDSVPLAELDALTHGGDGPNQSGLRPSDALRFRSVFISDLHLGFVGCSAEALLAFLRTVRTEQLVLVGDILDLTCASSDVWPDSHHEVIRQILELSTQGTHVIYVPGNHDEVVRQFDGGRFGNIEIRREWLHETADGRRFLVLHGDEFDDVVKASPWLEAMGGRAYAALLFLTRHINEIGGRLGLPPCSIAASLKRAAKATMQHLSKFEESLACEVRRRGLDGLICGHIHRPEIVDIQGVLYCNDGDWVESRTALTEDFEGHLALLHWDQLEAAGIAHDSSWRELPETVAARGNRAA